VLALCELAEGGGRKKGLKRKRKACVLGAGVGFTGFNVKIKGYIW